MVSRHERRLELAQHVLDTLRIGLPLAAAQLAQVAMSATDAILLGRLGPDALAAGGLGNALCLTVLVVLEGIVGAVGVFVAQAIGGGRGAEVPALFWTGLLLTALLSSPAFLLLGMTEPLLLALGEPAALAHDAAAFLDVLRWSVPWSLVGSGLMRAFLPAIGAGWVIFPVTVAATLSNGIAGMALILGGGGCRCSVRGARLWRPCWPMPATRLLAAARVRRPTMAPVRALDAAAMGGDGCDAAARVADRRDVRRGSRPVRGGCAADRPAGPAALAAQQVAIRAITIAFMVPMGLAQAANIRVGHPVGGAMGGGAAAGLIAIGLAAVSSRCVRWRAGLAGPDRRGWPSGATRAGRRACRVAVRDCGGVPGRRRGAVCGGRARCAGWAIRACRSCSRRSGIGPSVFRRRGARDVGRAGSGGRVVGVGGGAGRHGGAADESVRGRAARPLGVVLR